MKSKKKCKYCNTTDNLRKGYRKGKEFEYPVCTKEDCFLKYKQDKTEKRRRTTLEKYGVENIAQLESSKISARKTNLKKYGFENPSKNKDVIEKRIKTNQKKYGGNSPSSDPTIKRRIQNTCMKRYGVDNPIKNPDIKQKALETTQLRFGVDNVFKLKRTQDNIKKIFIEKYGTPYIFQNEEIKQKIWNTNYNRYGTKIPIQNKDIKQDIIKNNKKSYWGTYQNVLNKKRIEMLFTKDDYINQTENYGKFKCLFCNTEFISERTNPHDIYCSCKKRRSLFEDEIITWLNSIGINNIKSNEKFYKNGKYIYEVDIFIEDLCIGIDFCGVYWHSDLFKKYDYHQKKFLFFKEKEIQLIQIFENEWIYKREIVQSLITTKLNQNKRIFARKCVVKEISNEESRIFLNKNHLQGYVPSKYKIGLFYNNDLVALAMFNNYRFKKTSSIELTRFSYSIGISVVGGVDKLLNYFIKKYYPKEIISFVDLRYFTGNSFLNSGFKLDTTTKPNYFYFNKKEPYNLQSRVKYQKHKLKDIIDKFDPNLSEYENMLNNNYLRIFDAGNYKIIKEII